MKMIKRLPIYNKLGTSEAWYPHTHQFNLILEQDDKFHKNKKYKKIRELVLRNEILFYYFGEIGKVILDELSNIRFTKNKKRKI